MMLAFPQINLYPVTKKAVKRAVVNSLADGRIDTFADSGASATAWELRLIGMTRAEWDSVEALFDAAAGSWKTFTFLDPVGNLLARSEEFGASAWTNGPLVALTPGVTDPFGTSRATHVVNAGAAVQSVSQMLAVPTTFQFCLSVWAQGTVTLVVGASSKRFELANWTRVAFTGSGTTFGVQLDPGASADLFGMQVEAQIAASDYKKTGARGGVFSKARFAEDRIAVTAQGTDVFDAVVRIVSTEN
jgi:hypothetical protein